MLELLTDPHAWVALLTLTLLEIVLGIDNVIFISVLAQRLPAAQRQRAARLGLALALLTRVALLGMLFWLSGLTATLFSVLGHAVSARDLILFGGGLFLMAKATTEIHATLEEAGEREAPTHEGQSRFWSVVAQIGLIDVVFSLDSVITAIGLARNLSIMVAAIVISIAVMMVAADVIGRFVDRHPTLKMLALSFLILIGFALVAEALGLTVPKGYIYFAMAFATTVELLNLRLRSRHRAD
ncbi:MAG: TerC family protein [Gammaproteobacteria bacterium]|nr:TerC family protein [Gammaproteobacteria bacterium]MCP5136322.1 TerC family protein [Gammaproteobacteria bacterium]